MPKLWKSFCVIRVKKACKGFVRQDGEFPTCAILKESTTTTGYRMVAGGTR